MLPAGWAACEVAEIAADDHGAITDGPFGSALKSSDYTSDGIRVIRLGNIGSREFLANDDAYIDEGRREELKRHEVEAGDLLTAALGEPLGRTCAMPDGYGSAIVKADCFRLRPAKDVHRKLLLYWLNSPAVLQSFLDRSQGIGRVRINLSTFRSTFLPLQPLAEQRRIVAKLDALTARLARARAELERVVTLQTRLRRIVFDAAVTGKLTPLTTRSAWSRDQWQSISELRADYLCNRRGSRLRSGLGPIVEPLYSSQSGWLDCRLADVVSLRVGHAFRSTDFAVSGVRLLRGANIAPGRIDWSDIAYMPESACDAYSQHSLCEGDIVLAMDRPLISSGLKIARVGFADQPCLLVQRVANPRPSRFILNGYLEIVLQSSLFLRQIEEHATGTDLPHISSNDILTTSCPLPPLDEQQRIVEVAQKSLARADRLEAEAARARALLDRLEAAILAKAFRGELVPQDPAEEPASVLLDRIRAERAAAPKPKRGRRSAPPLR